MQQITNMMATEQAGLALRAWQARHTLPSTQDCALVWVESYTEPNGTPVSGFKAGFMLGPIMKAGRDPRWVLATLPDGTRFYVLPPIFHWSASNWYLIEKIEGFAMYSIRTVRRP